MIISDEQVRRVVEYLQTAAEQCTLDEHGGCVRLPAGFLEEVRAIVETLPDVRADRIEEARRRLAAMPPPDEIAAKLIGRVISDCIR